MRYIGLAIIVVVLGNARSIRGDEPAGSTPPPAIAPFDAEQAKAHQEAWAKHLDTDVEISNTVGTKLRLIPPGEFTMGSPLAEVNVLIKTGSEEDGPWRERIASESPQHHVTLTKAFYLGVYEVTQKEYEEVTGVNPSHFSATGPGKNAVQGADTGAHPVEMVSWLDAVVFCNKLSETESLKPYYLRKEEAVTILGGNGYRLPTEAEWEYACRAGTITRLSFGEANSAQFAWLESNSGMRTHPVGKLAANPYGLYDMHGNVYEWCWDCFGWYATTAASDPAGPFNGAGGHVLRGGGFKFGPTDARSARRDHSYELSTRGFLDGFRVARSCK